MLRLIRWPLRFAGDARGTAAVEAGLAFPFIVLFGAGLFEYGSLFYNFELIQTGVRDAARYLSRVRDPVAAEAAARNLALRGTVDATGTLRIRWWQAADIQITYETTPNPVNEATGRRLYRGRDPLVVVRVATAFDHNGLGLLNAVGLGPVRVTAAHEERYVGE
jgi:Flp pilus assembly protein TadG